MVERIEKGERHFNPRSPHGERPNAEARAAIWEAISIHAPRTGSDDEKYHIQPVKIISIHAPRTGSDVTYPARFLSPCHFNPRSPHGERLPGMFWHCLAYHFNPRSPHGERLINLRNSPISKKFQSTLPARGATVRADIQATANKHHFNPRSPHGERPLLDFCGFFVADISIHAPRTGSDRAK